MKLTDAINYFKAAMKSENICPENGLGTEGFQFASTLMPVINVDLLIINQQKEILLSWRNDPHCGVGWHVPGGCIRFMETAEDRIQKTALNEIGTEVECSMKPITVFEIFSKEYRDGITDQRERAHFITLVYFCKVSEQYEIPAEKAVPEVNGQLKWFKELPDDLLSVQNCYRKEWKNIKEKIMEDL